jgi:hypothetical protein
MGVTINGNNITITNATLEIVNGANPDSGVSYIIITPDGGVGELPFMAQGLPGQATLFPVITYIQLAAGTPLPSPNPVSTLVDPGGPGLPAKYSLTFYGNAGPTGATGSPSFAGASDLASSPVLGALTDKFNLIYRSSDSKFVPTAQKNGESWAPATIASTAFNNTSPRLLHTITIGPQPFAYRVDAFAQTVVTGSVDTRVDLVVRMNDPATGDQVGYGKGLIGINAAGIQTVLIPAYPAGSSVPGAYGQVAINTSASFYLRAEQKAGSSNSWSTPASPDTTFTIDIHPLT